MNKTPTTPALFATELFQIDRSQFGMRWCDGTESCYHLEELQKNCPCAACEGTPQPVKKDVQAISIRSVGRYGLKIEFTSGCRHGIFSYEQLWVLAQRPNL